MSVFSILDSIQNIGNTLVDSNEENNKLNKILQCFFYLREIKDAFTKEENAYNFSSFPLNKACYETCTKIYSSENNDVSSEKIILELKKIFLKKNENNENAWNSTKQNIPLLIKILFDSLHEEINPNALDIKQQNSHESISNQTDKNYMYKKCDEILNTQKSIISEQFFFIGKKKTRCRTCGFSTYEFFPKSIFSFNLNWVEKIVKNNHLKKENSGNNNLISVDDCFQTQKIGKKITNFSCQNENCPGKTKKEIGDYWEQLYFGHNIITIIFERNDLISNIKQNDVDFPKVLNIKEFLDKDNENEINDNKIPYEYNLKCLIAFYCNEKEEEKCVCFCRNDKKEDVGTNEEWYKYEGNDKNIINDEDFDKEMKNYVPNVMFYEAEPKGFNPFDNSLFIDKNDNE